MAVMRFIGLALFEAFVNLGIALGLTLLLMIFLRPITNRLLRPKYRVLGWMMACLSGYSWSYYSLVGRIRLLPVTVRGWIAPRVSRLGVPAYLPEVMDLGEQTAVFPGGREIPFVITEGMQNGIGVATTVGFILLFLWTWRQERQIKRFLREREPMSRDWHWNHELFNNEITVHIVESLPTSFVCRVGAGKHHICLQKELPEEQMELVLLHELTHIKGRHVWFKGVLLTMMVFYWWNPVMWMAYRLACRDMELACDEAVLQQLDEKQRRTYAVTLVELAGGKPMWGGLTCFGECDAQIRVRGVVDWTREKPWAAVVVWPALILAFLLLFTSPRTGRAEQEARWLEFSQGPGLVEDLRDTLGDLDVHIEELWERDKTLMIRTDGDEWHLFAYRWNHDTRRYDCISRGRLFVEPTNLDQYQRIPAWDGDIPQG